MSKTTLWDAAEAAKASGGRLEGAEAWTATGVSIDTRTLEPGDLFVALSDKRDGHEFAQSALDKGAAAVMVARPDCAEGPKIVVDDVLAALRRLGEGARERSAAWRVGVTGSVGKTSVKEALAAVFRAAGTAHWSEKSYNNHWGVPLTLARMPQETRRAVFEMGMNHAGEISALTAQVRPHIALITKIAPAHLENLGSMEAIADAKGEIYEGLTEDGIAILPHDDEFAARLSAHAGRSKAGILLTFGEGRGAAVRITRFEENDEGVSGRLDVLGRPVDLRLSASGHHSMMNAAAVMTAAVASGLEAGDVAETLSRQRAGAGRGESFTLALAGGGEALIVDDSYNANPASMRAAIEALSRKRPGRSGRRIAVLGEMLELGPESEAMHAALAGPLAQAGVSRLLTVGEASRALCTASERKMDAAHYKTAHEALEQLRADLRDGDVVLIKGSNASSVHKIVAHLREGADAPSNA